MGYSEKDWKSRKGNGLNKFSINGAEPVSLINTPDNITEQGDAFSTQNMNNLEYRILSGINSVEQKVELNYQTLPVLIYDRDSQNSDINWNSTSGFTGTKNGLSLGNYEIIEAHCAWNTVSGYHDSKIITVPIDRMLRARNASINVPTAVKDSDDTVVNINFSIGKDPDNGIEAYYISFVNSLNGVTINRILGYQRVPIVEIPSVNLEPTLLTEIHQGNLLSIVDTDADRVATVKGLKSKNLLENHSVTIPADYGTYDQSTGTISFVDRPFSSANQWLVGHVILEKGKTYTLSCTMSGGVQVSSGYGLLGLYTRSDGHSVGLGISITTGETGNKIKTATVENTGEYVLRFISSQAENSIAFTAFVVSNLLLEESPIQTAFEPYIEDGTAVEITANNANFLNLTGDNITLSNRATRVGNGYNYVLNVIGNGQKQFDNTHIFKAGTYRFYVTSKYPNGTHNPIYGIHFSVFKSVYINTIMEVERHRQYIEFTIAEDSLLTDCHYILHDYVPGDIVTFSDLIICTLSHDGEWVEYNGSKTTVIYPLQGTITVPQYDGVTNISTSKGLIEVKARIDSNVIARHLNGVYARRPTDTKPYPRYYVATDTTIPSTGARQSFLDKGKSGVANWIKIV